MEIHYRLGKELALESFYSRLSIRELTSKRTAVLQLELLLLRSQLNGVNKRHLDFENKEPLNEQSECSGLTLCYFSSGESSVKILARSRSTDFMDSNNKLRM